VDETLISHEVLAIFEHDYQLSFDCPEFLRQLVVVAVAVPDFENALVPVELQGGVVQVSRRPVGSKGENERFLCDRLAREILWLADKINLHFLFLLTQSVEF
jgi:hypothetical protein